jgi:hypothetical protein
VIEVVVYGLLAAAVIGGILYADGRSLEQIGVVVGAVIALVVVFAIIAPRARTPVLSDHLDNDAPSDDSPPESAPTPPHRAGKRGRRRRR